MWLHSDVISLFVIVISNCESAFNHIESEPKVNLLLGVARKKVRKGAKMVLIDYLKTSNVAGPYS